MTDTTYNGWKNYPTWAVNLWLSNDEWLYTTATEMAFWSKQQGWSLADRFKAWVRDTHEGNMQASLSADLLGYALGQVDWNEIATAWLEGVEA